MPSPSVLQRILGPLTVDEFVGKYFQRRPLRLSGPQNKFAFLFCQNDFPVNLDRVKHIRAVFRDNQQARIRPVDIEDMFNAGATICITGMERAHSKLCEAARLIGDELNYAGNVSFRAYLSPPGSGFDLHFDARVTTTLQISGKKRWWFSKEPAVPFPTHNSGQGTFGLPQYRPPNPAALRSVVLRPGDVLCLPAGVWHSAKGTTMSLALNMAFDHNSGGVFDSIMNMLQKSLMQDPAWREPLPVAPHSKGRKLPESVASVLRERIDALQMELSNIRDNDAALRDAWQMSIRSKSPM